MMQYSIEDDPAEVQFAGLRASLGTLLQGLGMELIELCIFRPRGSPKAVQIRAIVYKPGAVGINDCSRAHHAIVPRLELEFPGHELSLEVSSPGITRQVKDGAELAHYRGRGVRLWRTDISDWSAGLLEEADERGIIISGKEGKIRLDYALVAKARLDPSQEEDIGH